jgi:hypothetical protein
MTTEQLAARGTLRAPVTVATQPDTPRPVVVFIETGDNAEPLAFAALDRDEAFALVTRLLEAIHKTNA